MYLKGKRGDVVIALFPFEEDPYSLKPRPIVIIREDCASEYYVCKITKTDRCSTQKGFWILKDSHEGKTMGLDFDSFVSVTKRRLIDKKLVIKKIGICPFMDNIDKI